MGALGRGFAKRIFRVIQSWTRRIRGGCGSTVSGFDVIVHVPFERGLTRVRREGNFVAVEIKRDLSDVPAAFENLAVIEGALDYALALVVMVNSSTHCRAVPGGYRAKNGVLRSPAGERQARGTKCRDAVSRQSNSAKGIVTRMGRDVRRGEAVGVP